MTHWETFPSHNRYALIWYRKIIRLCSLIHCHTGFGEIVSYCTEKKKRKKMKKMMMKKEEEENNQGSERVSS